MRLQTTIRDADFEKIKKVAEESGQTMNDVVREALQLYLWAKRMKKEGKLVGAMDEKTNVLQSTLELAV
jgi:hypothetical protein